MAFALIDKVYVRVVDGIRADRFRVGSTLPSTANLAGEINCSAGTVERALTRLAAEGVLCRVRNRGTLVLRKPPLGHVCVLLSFDDHLNQIVQNPLVTALRDAGYDADLVPCTGSAAEAYAHCARFCEVSPTRDLLVAVLAHINPEDVCAFRALVERFRRTVVFSICENELLSGLTVLTPDHRQATRLVMEHLARLGHRRVGVCAGWPGERGTYAAAAAEYGADLMAMAGGECVPVYLNEPDAVDVCRAKGVTAYWALHDHDALMAANAAHRDGLRIPDDLSLVGRFGTPWSQQCRPPLTTVHISTEALVLAILSGLADARPVGGRVPMEMVVRESTGPAPPPADEAGKNLKGLGHQLSCSA